MSASLLREGAMFEFIDRIIADLDLNVCETVDLPARRQSRALTPEAFSTGPASRILPHISEDGKLWKHQSLALKQLHTGKNVVVSTGTASGKSLIFQFYALHRLLTEPDCKVLVFYPLRALASDQLVKWRQIAGWAGLRPKDVARIDGSVAMNEREHLIEQARVVLMTPDVCQAWFMRTLASQPVNRFLDSLSLLVLDEAHVYESVFGSNAAFLIRRLLAAKRRVSQQRGNVQLQVVAATATIAQPEEHLKNLTGLRFKVVSEGQDGAPRYRRRILHIEGPDQGADGEAAIAKIVGGIHNLETPRRFIAFMDSRQGVERIARQVDLANILPYRSGYEPEDRRMIERKLRTGELNGVVSTSALELGIDIKDMEIGINLGVPQSRKSFRQRLGRVGRASPGVFLIVAPTNAFTQFGESLQDYNANSVEPSYLYLGNRFVQFAHARCLRDELEVLSRDTSGTPGGVNWPDGFPDVLRSARAGWPREFDFVAQIGGDSPHYNYSLRQVGEATLPIHASQGDMPSDEIGDIALRQAIREAYPGAIYLNLRRPYRVVEWSRRLQDQGIIVSPARSHVRTRPILRKIAAVNLSPDGIVDGRIKKGPHGLIAEAHIQVTESVEGYWNGSTRHHYRDLRADNANMTRKQRYLRTTGIVIRVGEDWFGEPAIRDEVAVGLLSLLCRDRSIAPQDVDAASTNIVVTTQSGPRPVSDTVVIHDSVHGGLRLTESLFDNFEKYIEQLSQAASIFENDAIISRKTAERLVQWAQALNSGGLSSAFRTGVPDGWLQVYKRGSVVGVYSTALGDVVQRELIEPMLIEKGLYYRYRHDDPSVSAITPHDQVQPVGDQWDWELWNPDTSGYRDFEPED